MPFSALISVYYKENPSYLSTSLESVFNQTLPPTEVVLVKDGSLTPELDVVINHFTAKYPSIKVVALPNNVGLGLALREGLNHCSYDIVARMDSDDICFQERFEYQLDYLLKNPDFVLVGCYIKEFNKAPNDIDQIKKVPIKHNEIVKYSKKRSPFNHPSVMFRKTAIINSGSYIDMPFFEDYYLWLRLLAKGYKVANIAKPLLYFRVGNDMVGRRHGWSYAKKEFVFYNKCYKENLLCMYSYYSSIILRIPLRLLPKSTLRFIYKTFLR